MKKRDSVARRSALKEMTTNLKRLEKENVVFEKASVVERNGRAFFTAKISTPWGSVSSVVAVDIENLVDGLAQMKGSSDFEDYTDYRGYYQYLYGAVKKTAMESLEKAGFKIEKESRRYTCEKYSSWDSQKILYVWDSRLRIDPIFPSDAIYYRMEETIFHNKFSEEYFRREFLDSGKFAKRFEEIDEKYGNGNFAVFDSGGTIKIAKAAIGVSISMVDEKGNLLEAKVMDISDAALSDEALEEAKKYFVEMKNFIYAMAMIANLLPLPEPYSANIPVYEVLDEDLSKAFEDYASKNPEFLSGVFDLLKEMHGRVVDEMRKTPEKFEEKTTDRLENFVVETCRRYVMRNLPEVAKLLKNAKKENEITGEKLSRG